MPTIYSPAEVFLEHNGVKVYYVYKNDDKDQGIVRDYIYSLQEDSSDYDDPCSFDVRDLVAYESHGDVAAAIIDALDSGDLDDYMPEEYEI